MIIESEEKNIMFASCLENYDIVFNSQSCIRDFRSEMGGHLSTYIIHQLKYVILLQPYPSKKSDFTVIAGDATKQERVSCLICFL